MYWDNLQVVQETPAAPSFDVQVARDAAFTDLVHNATSVTSPYAATNLSGNTAYFWRVRARNGTKWYGRGALE